MSEHTQTKQQEIQDQRVLNYYIWHQARELAEASPRREPSDISDEQAAQVVLLAQSSRFLANDDTSWADTSDRWSIEVDPITDAALARMEAFAANEPTDKPRTVLTLMHVFVDTAEGQSARRIETHMLREDDTWESTASGLSQNLIELDDSPVPHLLMSLDGQRALLQKLLEIHRIV
jgi:hypothetical protein